MNKDSLIIGIPAYNEATHIGSVIEHILKSGYHRVVVVDDGSSDNTCEVARKAGAKVIKHPINCGAGAGVQTLLTLGRMEGWEYLILIDADGQHKDEDISKLMDRMEETGADLVVGDRFSTNIINEIPRIKQFYNSLANVLTNFFCKGSYSDTQSGFRLLNSKAIIKIELESTGFGFCSEMILRAEKVDLKIAEVGIQVLYTEYSRSKGQNNIWNGIRTAWQFLENI